MTPEDPRHGSYAGAVQHWFDKERPCDQCARAEWRYRKTRQLRALQGNPATVPAIGTKRRIEALHALGWARRQIADASGVSLNTLHSIFAHESTRVLSGTANAIADAYDRMSMTLPSGGYADRGRAAARRRGWLPPLAWDEDTIDNPDARPHSSPARPQNSDDIDPVAVERAVLGEHLPLTRAERHEAIRRWPGSINALERLHPGWNVSRDLRAMRAEEQEAS